MERIYEVAKYIGYASKALFSDTTLKSIFALVYIAYAFLFDPLHSGSILAVVILIIMDFITGIYAAKVSGEEIKSRKVLRSAVKVVVYLGLISAAHLFERTVSFISIADDTVIGFLAATELISLFENAGKVGFAVPKKLLNKLKEYRDAE